MPNAKRGGNRTIGAGRKCCVVTLAWLAFAWARPAFPADAPAPGEPPASSPAAQVSDDADVENQPADAVPFSEAGAASTAPAADAPAEKPAAKLRLAPIAIRWGGDVGYDIEQRGARGGNSTLRQRVTLNLKGKAATYIMQPWIAQVRGDLGLNSSKSRSEDTGASSNTISGGAGLYVVPYSRYPFEARISRNQNYSGPGIGLPVSQTTRLDMIQRYSPRHRKESYSVGFNRSLTGGEGVGSDRMDGLNFTMQSNRFKQQALEAEGSRERGTRSSNGLTRQSSLLKVHHTYRELAELTVDNNANLTSSSDNTEMSSTSFINREVNSTLFFQPPEAPYSVIGTARVNVSDVSAQQTSTRTRVANLNLSASYRPHEYITMSAGANVNVTDSERTQSLNTAQTAAANIPLAANNLGSWRYTSFIGGALNNTTNPNNSSQSASLSPSHGLNRSSPLGSGTLSLGLNQSVNVTESTRSKTSARLTHSGSANWRRSQGGNFSTLRLSGRDSRSLSRTKDSFQSVDVNATTKEQFSRYSSLSGSLTVRTTRQETLAAPETRVYTTSSASLHYNHQRAFDITRLIFDSDVQARSQSIAPVFVATPEEQGPVTWENALTYTIGRLASEFHMDLSKESDGSTQYRIALALKRYF